MNIRRTIYKTQVVALFLTAVAAYASADKIELSNGDRLTGTLIGISGQLVEFDTGYAGLLRIQQDHVTTIESDKRFLIVSDDGSRNAVNFAASIDVSSIQMARSDAEILLGGASVLSNEVDLSASYSTGNSSTQVYLLTTESQLTRPESEHVLKSAFHFDVAEGEQLKNQLNVNYKTRNFFRDKWFYALNADGFRDPLKAIDLRVAPTLGIGHRFWDHTYSALTVEIGVAAIFEQSDELTSERPAVSWELDFTRRFFGGRLEAFHEHRLLTAIDDGFVFDSSNGLKYAFVQNISLNLLANLKHDTNVPEGFDKTDITYVTGIGLTF
ncbi:MAG: DUF481 domain-containing protein [Gammaproteobacteria bacterium]|nr:DUF481 domain-containing protein [Gammaproteobacteria bacterium]